jgi:hypothetical protein
MKAPREKITLGYRQSVARLIVLIVFGIVVIFCVARFAVPAIYPVEGGGFTTKFSSGTVMPGGAARPGLHFGISQTDAARTRYLYLRIGSKAWVFELIHRLEQ